jgi:hypothetical protein
MPRGGLKKMRVLIGSIVCFLFISSGRVSGQNACHVADRQSAVILAGLKAIMGTNGAPMRTRFSIATAPPAEVVLVNHSTTCARAGLAADSLFTALDPTDPAVAATAPLYVFKVGASFALADPNQPSERKHHTPVLIFGPAWEYRGLIFM